MILRRARSIALTVAATVGSLCLLVAAVCVLAGLRPLVFQSGSMSPAIPAGSVALARSVTASDVARGDVVSVIAANGVRVTHRVVALDAVGQERLLTLQGDANNVPDREVYRVRQVDRVVAHAPYAGYAVAFLQGRLGLLLLGGLAAALLFTAFRPAPRPAGRRRAARGAVPVVAAAAIVASAAPTMAWFTDAGTISTGALGTHTVLAPASASCSSALLTATIQWPADSRYDYEVVLRRISTGSVVSTTQVTGANSSITYSGLASFGLLVGAGTVDFQVEITSYLANATTWRAAGPRTYTAVRVFAIAIGATATCTT